MLRIRRRLYPWVERGVLATRWLRADRIRGSAEGRRFIFVCTGNICRSPYAELIAREMGVSAISCGTHTNNGLSADATAITEAARRGKDLRNHRTTRWEDVELKANDVIVAMQLRHAISALPRARKEGCQILLFSSLLREFGIIWDPYGGPQDEYARTFDLIEDGIQFITRQLNGRLHARHQATPGEL